MIVTILFLALFNNSLFGVVREDLTIPSGKIVNEELYWMNYNDFIDQQEKIVETRSNILIRKENLKALKIKELFYIKLEKSGASCENERDTFILKRKQEEVEIKILQNSLKKEIAKLKILKSKIESSLKVGFKGNLKSFIENNNKVIYNSKCQERYLKLYLNKISFEQTTVDYKRALKLYGSTRPSISYSELLDSRQLVVSTSLKTKAWHKLSKICLNDNIAPVGLDLIQITDINHVKVPTLPKK